MGTLNDTGYETQSFATIKTAIQNILKAAFGADIALDDETPQGVLVNQLAEQLEDCENIGLAFFNALDPAVASGELLSLLAIVRGTARRTGTKAVYTVTLTSSSTPYTILSSAVFALIDDSTKTFSPSASITVSSASQSATLQAVDNGISGATIGDKLQVSIGSYAQLTDVEITAIEEGTADETDAELRARLKIYTSALSRGSVDDIYSALMELDDVTRCNVVENDTTGTVDSIPAHSIECLVLGGTDEDVGTTIFNYKDAGTPTYSDTADSYVVTDTQGTDHEIYFTRPTIQNIYVRATVVAKEGKQINAGNFDAIKTECITYVSGLKIGENVSYTSIYGKFAKYEDFDIDTLELSLDESDWVSTNLTVASRSYASLIADDITIST